MLPHGSYQIIAGRCVLVAPLIRCTSCEELCPKTAFAKDKKATPQCLSCGEINRRLKVGSSRKPKTIAG